MLSAYIKPVLSILLVYLAVNPLAYANRIALVIGNSQYPLGKLASPANDATALSKTLKAKDFSVTLLKNADKRQMKQAIKQFNRQLNQPNAVGFFYFAGHAIELNGKNYLLPVDAEINSEADVEFEGIDIRRILTGMQWAGNYLNMLVLDASRSNPYTLGFKKTTSGLNKVDAVKNSLILFSTSPGTTISDSNQKNGLFTEKLIAAIKNPKLKAPDVFKLAAKKTSSATGKKQIPWLSGLSVNEFYFTDKPSKRPDAKPTKQAQPSEAFKKDVELEFWISIKDSNMPSYFEAYLKKYGEKGQFTPIAKIKLAELKKQQTKPEQPPAAKTKPEATKPGKTQALPVKQPTPETQPQPKQNQPEIAKPKPPVKLKAFPLTVRVQPEQAEIKILNIKPKFKQGMLLPNGPYHIVVSSPGYQKVSKWVTVKDQALTVDINLKKQETKEQAAKPVIKKTASKPADGFEELHKGDEFYLKHFDYKTAVAWYKKSAELGNPIAEATLAKLYFNGIGVKKDRSRSKALGKHSYPKVAKLAEQGNRDAQFALANLYQFGLGITRNYAKAFEWYQKAAEQNLASAQNNLGALYKHGYGVQQSNRQAVHWYHLAAEQGDALAQYNLAEMLEIGLGVKKDEKQAFNWYLKAAVQGDPYSQNKLGNIYLSGQAVKQDFLQAANWYRQAAQQGHAPSQTNLGIMFVTGSGVEKDPKQAVLWFQKAANQGHADGQNKLGIMYQAGEGVEQDFKEAVRWFTLSAKQGNSGGQTNLGYMYQYGKGLEQDYKQAVSWYTKAADQGDAKGRYLLATMYEAGLGVEKNIQEARYLYNKAARQGLTAAKKALARLEAK